MLGLDAASGHAVLLGTIAQALRRTGLITTPCALGLMWDVITTSGFAAQMAMSFGTCLSSFLSAASSTRGCTLKWKPSARTESTIACACRRSPTRV
jgi:hypothetical protein